jgi:hypothetical protein
VLGLAWLRPDLYNMFDTEKFIIVITFITEIRGNPTIWDTASSDYQNRDENSNV